MATRQDLEALLNSPNVQKYLNLISQTEGTTKNGYATAFGGSRLKGLVDHPRTLHSFTQTDGKVNKTSAAGRYQFLRRTWDDVKQKYGLQDFGPRSQDIGALALINQSGALGNVLAGDFRGAIKKTGGIWASLPSSPYAQPKRSWQQVDKMLGTKGHSGGGGGGGTMANELSVNDLVKIAQSARTQKTVTPKAAPVSTQLSADDLVNIVKSAQPLTRQSNFKAIDPRAEAEKQVAKEAGPTKPWQSALLGASDLGAGVLQGATYVSDGFNGLVNKALGTNLDTDNYENFTKNRQDVERFHNQRREQNGQGFDGYRVAGAVAATAPLVVGSGGSTLAPTLGQVALRGAGTGAAIAGASFAPDAGQRIKNAAIGGVAGAGGAVAGKAIGKAAVAVNQKLNPVARQQLQARLATQVDNELTMALRQHNVSMGDLSDAVQAGLRQDVAKALSSGKTVNTQAVARKAILDKLGLKGTKAQITGDPKLWQKQAELAKIQGAGDPLRDKLVQDNVQLAGLLDDAAAKTGGAAPDQYGAMQGATNSLLTKNAENKQFIRSAYDTARTAAGNDLPLDGAGFTNDAITALERNYAMSSMPSSVGKILKDIQGNPGQFTLGKSEELIKILNREYKSSLVNGQPSGSTYAIGVVRDALTNRQQQAVQGILANGSNDAASAWQVARQAAKTNAARIEGSPLLQDALKGVEPDKLFSKHILNGNAAQIKATADELAGTNPQALADIKQQVIQHIGSKAINQNGQFSPAGMKRGLDSIGDRRLNALFTPEEVTRLKDIGQAGHYLVTQPAHSYVNNSNTSAALMNFLGGIINKPGVRVLLSPLKDAADSVQVKAAMKSSVAGQANAQTSNLSGAEKELIANLERMGVVVTPQMFSK